MRDEDGGDDDLDEGEDYTPEELARLKAAKLKELDKVEAVVDAHLRGSARRQVRAALQTLRLLVEELACEDASLDRLKEHAGRVRIIDSRKGDKGPGA